MSAVAVIVAAGRGERFGDAAKVLAPLVDRPVLAWTLDAFQQAASVDEVLVVAADHSRAAIAALIAAGSWSKVTAIVPGGSSRQRSMANGVQAVRADADVILVHDAARPLTTPAQIDTTVAVARRDGAAILAAPASDTIKRGADGRIVETIDRREIWHAQTPQAFSAEHMRAIAALAVSDTVQMTDEASLAEHLGYPVTLVPGDSTNLKITHPHDIPIAAAILHYRKEHAS